MIEPNKSFIQRIDALEANASVFKDIQHGVEREALKIQKDGSLSLSPHAPQLGSALTHDSITTDFSESLLEFITPPERDIKKTIAQLADIHKYVIESTQERLWPLSMPCFVKDENDIPLANYGSSNVGKMKRVYRVGLKNRYGSMMQIIAGVHFNFSLPQSFWPIWSQVLGEAMTPDFQSEQYLSLLRNYRRYSWLIPYLYGASPSICSSFIKNKPYILPFEKNGKGSLYLPYATSLRLSDLGYTNKEQAKLQLCYNDLDGYVELLRNAMETPSDSFSSYASGEQGHWQQLSKNILQIENELYSSVRPKQPTLPLEKPTDALVNRGISYIEVRALDVNPFTPLGISEQQFYFLDVFLVTCAIKPSQYLCSASIQEAQANFKSIVLEGRRPSLILQRDGQSICMTAWAGQLFEEFRHSARLLDKANHTDAYSQAVEVEWQKIIDPSKTFSGRWLDMLLKDDLDNGAAGLTFAEDYHQQIQSHRYAYTDEASFKQQAEASLLAQEEKEKTEEDAFDTFITKYFAQPKAKKEAKKMPDG